MKKNRKPARIENDVLLKAHYQLSAIEQKLLIMLVSRIDEDLITVVKKKEDYSKIESKDFLKQRIPISEIKKTIWGKNKRVGDPIKYLDEVCTNFRKKGFSFPKGTELANGDIVLGGGLNWFSSIVIVKDKSGEKIIEFKFSDDMKPFILKLFNYVRLDALDIAMLEGKHSIRMYSIFKVQREKMRAHHKIVSTLTYGIDELKDLLGLSGKYKTLKDFRRRVLEPIKKEINENSNSISISFEYLKTRRKVTGIEFGVYDKKKEKIQPNKSEIKNLSFSKKLAYQILLDFGVNKSTDLYDMLGKIKAGEMEGFEDIFIRNSIEHFLKWTNKEKGDKDGKAGAFVKWWKENRAFDPNEENTVYWKIVERVHETKSKMPDDARENRYLAKGLPYAKFKSLVSGKIKKQNKGIEKIKELAEKMKM